LGLIHVDTDADGVGAERKTARSQHEIVRRIDRAQNGTRST